MQEVVLTVSATGGTQWQGVPVTITAQAHGTVAVLWRGSNLPATCPKVGPPGSAAEVMAPW